MRLESSHQAEIIRELKKRKRSFTHKHCPSPTGYPDVEHLECGVLFLFECKRTPKDIPSPIQARRHRELKRAGARVYVVYTWKQVKRIMNGFRKINKRNKRNT